MTYIGVSLSIGTFEVTAEIQETIQEEAILVSDVDIISKIENLQDEQVEITAEELDKKGVEPQALGKITDFIAKMSSEFKQLTYSLEDKINNPATSCREINPIQNIALQTVTHDLSKPAPSFFCLTSSSRPANTYNPAQLS